MSSLRSLIENQMLRIDDHTCGTGEICDWDNIVKDIHLDKRTYYKIGGKTQRITIKIPLNTNRPIKITNGKDQADEIPTQLKKEIQRVLANTNSRARFVADLIECLKDFKSLLTDEQKALDAINKISKHFELNYKFKIMTQYDDDNLVKITKIYHEKDSNYFIGINKDEIAIGDIRNLNSSIKGKYLLTNL